MKTGSTVWTTTSRILRLVRSVFSSRPLGSFIVTVAPYHWRIWRLNLAKRISCTIRSWYHVISNAGFAFIIINTKSVQYYFAARKLCHTKWNLDVMRRTIWSYVGTVFQPIVMNTALVRFSVSPFNHAVGISAIPQKFIPEIIVSLHFLSPRRLIVTTVRGYLFPLKKLNLFSNFGSYSMASLHLSLSLGYWSLCDLTCSSHCVHQAVLFFIAHWK